MKLIGHWQFDGCEEHQNFTDPIVFVEAVYHLCILPLDIYAARFLVERLQAAAYEGNVGRLGFGFVGVGPNGPKESV